MKSRDFTFFKFLLILNFYFKNSKKIGVFIDFIALNIKQVILHGSLLTPGKFALFIGHLPNVIFINYSPNQ